MRSSQASARDETNGSRLQPLPKEVASVLTQLAHAVQQFNMYPRGHPVLLSLVDSINETFDHLLADQGVISVGIGREQLMCAGGESSIENARLRSLAQRLHRHQLAAFSVEAGIEPDELTDFLEQISTEPELTQQPIGLASVSELRRWSHLRLQPIRYDRLGLVDGDNGAKQSGTVAEIPSHRPGPDDAQNLWRGLARAALLGNDSEMLAGLSGLGEIKSADELELEQSEGEQVRLISRALAEYASDTSYA